MMTMSFFITVCAISGSSERGGRMWCSTSAIPESDTSNDSTWFCEYLRISTIRASQWAGSRSAAYTRSAGYG